MTALLEAAIEAYGGMACWRGVRAIDVRFNFSGAVLVEPVVWRGGATFRAPESLRVRLSAG